MVKANELNNDEFKKRMSEDNKKLKKIVSNIKFRYKKNFSFFYDEIIIEKFRKDYPDKVKEYEQISLKKEPWLKYQQQNLEQRVNKMIFPSILEKREGVSRKGVGAHLVHLSYSENHERRMDDYGDASGVNSDINYGNHYTLSDITPVNQSQMNVEIKIKNDNNEEELVDVLINCDPSLIDNPHHEDCLDRLKRSDGNIRSQNVAPEIEELYASGMPLEEISKRFERNNISQSEIKKFIQKLDDYKIICMSFGLRGYESRTQEEIATVLKVTQPSVFKRINKIKSKLASIYIDLEKEVKEEEDRMFKEEDLDLYNGEDDE